VQTARAQYLRHPFEGETKEEKLKGVQEKRGSAAPSLSLQIVEGRQGKERKKQKAD